MRRQIMGNLICRAISGTTLNRAVFPIICVCVLTVRFLSSLYVNKAEVKLRIMDLEMSTIFLGAEKETSLNEANCLLVGLVKSPLGVPSSNQESIS